MMAILAHCVLRNTQIANNLKESYALYLSNSVKSILLMFLCVFISPFYILDMPQQAQLLYNTL